MDPSATTTAPAPRLPRPSPYLAGSIVVLGIALAYAFAIYALAWDAPLVDRHAFRQTQTAISAYRLAHGGAWFAYETPVLGAPYSIPFEFPLYQWIVAAIHVATSWPLDQVGRGTSIAFFLMTLVPFHRLLRTCGATIESANLGCAMLLVAPMYLYWTRTFLIESTALFFATSSLAIGARWLSARGSPVPTFALTVTTTLACLVKVTTAFAYLIPLGLSFLAALVADRARRAHLRAYVRFAAAAFVLPFAAVVAWTRFADATKRQNPLAADFITSTALGRWNYGTLEQRLDPGTWVEFWNRTMDETFGSALVFVVATTVLIFARRRLRVPLEWLAGIVGTYLVFTNVQLSHDYYQYSTGLLAVAVVALGLDTIARLAPDRRILILPLVAVGMLLAIRGYDRLYRIPQTAASEAPYVVGRFVRDHTRPNELLVLYGEDWSSVVPYYAERRAMANRLALPATDRRIRASLLESAARGHTVGAVVSCAAERGRAHEHARAYLGDSPRCEVLRFCTVCTGPR